MAQHSNSSGSGNLLVRGFFGILSITATAVVSTMVQRYFVPNAPSSFTPAPPMQASPIEAESLNSAPAASDFPPPEASWGNESTNESTEAGLDNSPIQVETQPVPEFRAVPEAQPNAEIDPAPFNVEAIGTSEPPTSEDQAQPDGTSLREKLDSALREKWNK
ncbi:MAG TPA: hypothetical protein V6C84_23000 [Coleofasciculaceae cyanobacterium]|jgi:hypothetical protein